MANAQPETGTHATDSCLDDRDMQHDATEQVYGVQSKQR